MPPPVAGLEITVSPQHVLRRIDDFMLELERLQFQAPENEAALARGALFAPRLAGAVGRAIALLEDAEAAYREAASAQGGVEDAESLSDIGRLISSEIAGQEIADVLLFAGNELRAAMQDLLASIGREDFLHVASSCDSGLRTLKRTLVSVESAVCEYEGCEPPQRRWADLEVSLRTRTLYGDLRRDLLGRGTPHDAELAGCLEHVRRRLRQIRDLDLYPLLRFDDRVALRDLDERLAAWLDGSREAAAGHRLWQDAIGLCELLRQVSYRQELRQHDRQVVRRAWERLFGMQAIRSAAEEAVVPLDSLLGLDDELDELLLAADPTEVGTYRPVLARLLHRLSATAAALTSDWPTT